MGKFTNILKKHSKTLRTGGVGIIAAVLMFVSVSGIMAYPTDDEVAKNVFTVGRVKIDLLEPDWPGNDDPSTENQLGFQETAKNPTIKNVGTNDAVVFIRMTVPVEEVITINDDGTKNAAARQELFIFKDAADAETAHANNFTSTWVELPAFETGTDMSKTTRTYVFGYSRKIAKNASTDPLFDKVQFKRLLEHNLPSGTEEAIQIEAFAIQAGGILNSGVEINTTGAIPAADLAKIYQTYINQNPD